MMLKIVKWWEALSIIEYYIHKIDKHVLLKVKSKY